MNDVFFLTMHASLFSFSMASAGLNDLGLSSTLVYILGFSFHYLAAWIPSFCGIALVAGL